MIKRNCPYNNNTFRIEQVSLLDQGEDEPYRVVFVPLGFWEELPEKQQSDLIDSSNDQMEIGFQRWNLPQRRKQYVEWNGRANQLENIIVSVQLTIVSGNVAPLWSTRV